MKWTKLEDAFITQDFYYPMKIDGRVCYCMIQNEWGDMFGFGPTLNERVSIAGNQQDQHEIYVLEERENQ